MIDIAKLAKEFPEIVFTEKRKVGGVNYRYIFQFINKPNIILIDKELTLYSCSNNDSLDGVLNHGKYTDDSFKKLLGSIINKLTDEDIAVKDACEFIKQGRDVLYKDSLLLKQFSEVEIRDKLALPNDNQKLISHLAQSYTMITSLISYIKRKEVKDSILNEDIQVVNLTKDTIKSDSENIEHYNDKKIQELEERRNAIYTKQLYRLCIKPNPNAFVRTTKRSDAYNHYRYLLNNNNALGIAMSQASFYKQLEKLNIQEKHSNIYYLKNTELIPATEYQFVRDDHV